MEMTCVKYPARYRSGHIGTGESEIRLLAQLVAHLGAIWRVHRTDLKDLLRPRFVSQYVADEVREATADSAAPDGAGRQALGAVKKRICCCRLICKRFRLRHRTAPPFDSSAPEAPEGMGDVLSAPSWRRLADVGRTATHRAALRGESCHHHETWGRQSREGETPSSWPLEILSHVT